MAGLATTRSPAEAAPDILIGGAGNDTLTGGTGNNSFVFAAGFGNDTITDFDAAPAGGQDHIDLSAFGITFADLTVTAVAGGTQVAHGADTILLQGVNVAAISATDFNF